MNSWIMNIFTDMNRKVNFCYKSSTNTKKLPKLKVILYGTNVIKKKNDLNMQKLIKCINI